GTEPAPRSCVLLFSARTGRGFPARRGRGDSCRSYVTGARAVVARPERRSWHEIVRIVAMRISEAARRLGTSARMLRYREELGLLPQVRDPLLGGTPGLGGPSTVGGPSHRQFSEADLEAVAVALELERRYDISPASLAVGLRVLAEPPVRVAVADLGRRLGRIPPTPGRALDFEKERALRLLSRG